MGRRTISPFIYDGMLEYHLRIPFNPITPHEKKKQHLYMKYYSKKEYTLEQVKVLRMNIIKEMESDGRRATDRGELRRRLIPSYHLN